MSEQLVLEEFYVETVEFCGITFTVLHNHGQAFLKLSELLKQLKLASPNKFLDGISFYCNQGNTISMVTQGGPDVALRIDLVLRRALSGHSSKMEALSNWIFGVFQLTRK